MTVPSGSARSTMPAISAERSSMPMSRTFTLPTSVRTAPGTTAQLYVGEKQGRIQVVAAATGVIRVEPFLDIRTEVVSTGERGLLDLVFDPRYETNGFVYVTYNSLDGNSHIARFTRSQEDPFVLDRDSEVRLKTIEHYMPNNGGHNQHEAFCLETQHYPDTPHRPEFPTTVLKPGEHYRQVTVHRFLTD